MVAAAGWTNNDQREADAHSGQRLAQSQGRRRTDPTARLRQRRAARAPAACPDGAEFEWRAESTVAPCPEAAGRHRTAERRGDTLGELSGEYARHAGAGGAVPRRAKAAPGWPTW